MGRDERVKKSVVTMSVSVNYSLIFLQKVARLRLQRRGTTQRI